MANVLESRQPAYTLQHLSNITTPTCWKVAKKSMLSVWIIYEERSRKTHEIFKLEEIPKNIFMYLSSDEIVKTTSFYLIIFIDIDIHVLKIIKTYSFINPLWYSVTDDTFYRNHREIAAVNVRICIKLYCILYSKMANLRVYLYF